MKVHSNEQELTARSPIFLVGAERSGTTLLRLMLDGHPQLAFQYEFELAVDCVPDGEGWPDLNEYYDWLRTFRFVDPPPHIDESLDYPSLVRSFLEQKRVRDGKPLVGATVHRHYDRLLRIWPDARFIHIVRDPRDVARSNVAMGWAGNVWVGAERWIEAERLWERVSATLEPRRFIEVRYEELVRAPERTLGRIAAFIGIPFDRAMLDYPRRSSYRPPDASRTEQWRATLSARETRLVEARVGDLLAARAYAPSGLPPVEVGPLARLALRAESRARCAHVAVRGLGIGLWSQRLIAERVGPKWWRDRVRRSINEVINAQLA